MDASDFQFLRNHIKIIQDASGSMPLFLWIYSFLLKQKYLWRAKSTLTWLDYKHRDKTIYLKIYLLKDTCFSWSNTFSYHENCWIRKAQCPFVQYKSNQHKQKCHYTKNFFISDFKCYLRLLMHTEQQLTFHHHC